MPTFLRELFELYVKRLIMKGGQGIKQIPNKDRVKLMADNLYKDFKKAGIPDEIIQTENDIKVFHHKIAEVQQENAIRAISADSAEGRKITEGLFGKPKAQVFDLKGNKIKNPQNMMSGEEIKVDIVADTIATIKSKKPIDAMKEANSVIGRKGVYKNLTPEESKKILKDTEDHIFERDIPIDPEDMAAGGRTGYKDGEDVFIGPKRKKKTKKELEEEKKLREKIEAYIESQNISLPEENLLKKYQPIDYSLYGGFMDNVKMEGDRTGNIINDFNNISIDPKDARVGISRFNPKTDSSFVAGVGPSGLNIGFKKQFADGGVAGLLGERTEYAWGGPGGKSPGTSSSGGTRGGPGPGGQGARGQATQNPGRTTRSAPAPTYQNVHQTGAVTQTPGRTVTPVSTGGPPSVLNPPTPPVTTGGQSPFGYTTPSFVNKYNKNNVKRSNFLKNFLKHRTNSQIMKGKFTDVEGYKPSYVPDYTHALGGYDFKQNFPNMPEAIAKGLAYGYQHVTETPRGIMNIDPTSSIFSDTGLIGSVKNSFNKANTEAAKNVEGFTGEGISQSDMDKYNDWQALNMAHGGPARQKFGFGRRAFLKLFGSGVAGIGAAKSGLFGLLKGGGKKQVVKELATSAGSGTPPPYFFKLVEKIKKLGDDVTETAAVADRQKVHQYKDFEMTEDIATGKIEIQKQHRNFIDDETPYNLSKESYMSYTPGEVISQGTKKGKNKIIKTADDYVEDTTYMRNDGPNTGGIHKVEDGVPQSVLDEVEIGGGNIDFPVKKASGGRVPLSGGGLAGMLGE